MAATRLPLLKNPNYVRNGLKSYVHLLRKYNINPTLDGPFKFVSSGTPRAGGQLVKTDPTTGTKGTVSAEDVQNDSEYLVEVPIGTPAQTLKLDFDTGSSDLWVWSTQLSPKPTNTAGHVEFNPSKSSTWKASSGETWQISYGDGSSASGTVGTDTISLGGITIQQQAIEIATTISAQFQQSAGDGLLGLAWDSINTVQPTPVKTPVDNLPNPQLFTAYLGSWRDASDPDKGESFYTFGAIDQTALGGQTPMYTPVTNSQGFWQFPSTSTVINGTSVALANNTAIADTGTTLALLDDASVAAVYKAIPGAKYDSTQQGYVFPSNTTAANLPVIQLAIGSHFVTLAKEGLGFADAGNGMVYGSIQSRGSMNLSILGDAMLKNIYAIFDQTNTRFGFVQRTEPTQNLAAPPAETS